MNARIPGNREAPSAHASRKREALAAGGGVGTTGLRPMEIELPCGRSRHPVSRIEHLVDSVGALDADLGSHERPG